MRRSGREARAVFVPGLCLAALLLAGTAALAQISGPATADAPRLTPGDAWTVRYSDGNRATKTFLREDGGVLVFEVSQKSPSGEASWGLLYLTPDLSTLRMLDAGGTELQRFAPHSLGLRFPLTVGNVWQGTSQRFDAGKDAGTFVGRYTVTGIETVTVPAGTLRAFRVEGQTYEVRAPTNQWRFVHWYVPEVRAEVKVQATEPDGRVTELELVEFRPAGQVSFPARVTKEVSDAFLGVWEGHWKETLLAMRLTVERINGDAVTAAYWRGAYMFPGLQRPSQQRVEGRFLDARTVRFDVWDDANKRWAEATYTLNTDGTLAARWNSGSIVVTGVLKKEP